MSEETERLINLPKEFKIGGKTVTVEALPAGAVTIIIQKIIEKIRTVDLELLKNATTEGADSIYDLFEKRLSEAMAKDYAIYQMILTPAATWSRTRGNLKKADFPVTQQELEWETSEAMLGEIFEEWLARNPRFSIQKKMVSLAAMQQ